MKRIKSAASVWQRHICLQQVLQQIREYGVLFTVNASTLLTMVVQFRLPPWWDQLQFSPSCNCILKPGSASLSGFFFMGLLKTGVVPNGSLKNQYRQWSRIAVCASRSLKRRALHKPICSASIVVKRKYPQPLERSLRNT